MMTAPPPCKVQVIQRGTPRRLGVVSYLNALPLYWTWLERGNLEAHQELPARLASQLDAGHYDAALLPVVDHFRGHGDGILSDAIIGATGPVNSVLLFSKVPLSQVTSVAADTSSHTSVALLRVLLRDLYNLQPTYLDAAPNLEQMLTRADSALLIGDPALEAKQRGNDLYVMDLAEAWLGLTGLPFVFAAWTARRGLRDKEKLARELQAARDEGKLAIPRIVASNPTGSLLPAKVIQQYLTHSIDHTLTAAHMAGLQEFQRRLQL